MSALSIVFGSVINETIRIVVSPDGCPYERSDRASCDAGEFAEEFPIVQEVGSEPLEIPCLA